MVDIERRIKEKLLAEGACDVGFGYDDNGVAGLYMNLIHCDTSD